MKKAILLTLFLLFLSQIWAQMPLRPKKYTPVNDFARVLTSSQKQELSSLLFQHEKTADEQFVFVTVANMGGETVENFSQQLYNGWGIGKKGNGALVLIAMAERKARIQVGTGLENRLTEAVRADILANQLVPNLKVGEFYQAFLQTAQVLTQKAEVINNKQENLIVNPIETPITTQYAQPEPDKNNNWFWVLAVAFVLVILVIMVATRNSNLKPLKYNNDKENIVVYKKENTLAYLLSTVGAAVGAALFIKKYRKTNDNNNANTADGYNEDTSDSSSYTDNSSNYTDNSSSYTDNSSSSSNDSSSSSDWGGGSSDSGTSSDW